MGQGKKLGYTKNKWVGLQLYLDFLEREDVFELFEQVELLGLG